MENLKYPIGAYTAPEKITAQHIKTWIRDIQTLPVELKKATAKLTEEQLDTPYRPDGWTVRQVIHHVADSHANAYVRFKLAMTEENPTIKPYEEHLWAELEDGKNAPISLSLPLIVALHKRWVVFLKSIDKKDLAKRSYFHPESKKTTSLAVVLGLYSWHGRHHLAHITSLIQRNNW
jgi:DinB superfamily